MNKLRSNKLFALFAAISSVIIIAGIILFALLGFNNAQDKPNRFAIDVSYDTTVVNGTIGEGDEKEDASAYLEKHVEEILKANGLSYEKQSLENGALTNSAIEVSGQQRTARYVFSPKISRATLEEVCGEIEAFTDTVPLLADGVDNISLNALGSVAIGKAAWRGAIAIAVGAVLALVYVSIRFGVSCGVAGLVVCVHDALFTAAFFAITRIPVFSFAPILYAAIAAFVSVAVWIAVCIKIRNTAKDPENAGIAADALADKSVNGVWKYVVCIAAVVAAIVVVFGLVAAAGTRALVLPAIVGCLVPVYSSLLIGPRVFVPIRKAFDKKRASKKGGYVRKKKKAELEAGE